MDIRVVILALACAVCAVAGKKYVPPGFEPVLSGARGGRTHAAHNQTWDEDWAYVTVRPKAHMFYWLQYSTHPTGYKNRPIVFWHQGGPGASSTGYGNMQIIGPEDIHGNYNEHTWLQSVSIVYLDSPVGSGYSYVEGLDALTTDIDEIADDLVTFSKAFFKEYPDFKTRPLYIFGESYGGKVAATFAQALHKAATAGEVECKLAGYALGNSWVSPIDSVRTWGPFLHEMSVLDEVGRDAVVRAANRVQAAMDDGKWVEATELWRKTQLTVMDYSNYVDFYNILHYTTFSTHGVSFTRKGKSEFSTRRHNRRLRDRDYDVMLAPFQSDNLYDYMNKECRQKLGIIPDTVIWSGQSGLVFDFQEGDFMKDSLTTIAETLNDTSLSVVIYQGQLDLICDTKGAMDYVQKLDWPGVRGFNKASRWPLTEPKDGQTDSYVKANGNFKFYWMLRAGHTVPEYMGAASLRMLNRVLEDTDR